MLLPKPAWIYRIHQGIPKILRDDYDNGNSEIIEPTQNYVNPLNENWNDGELTRNIVSQQSVSSIIHKFKGVAFGWSAKKPRQISDYTYASKNRARFSGVKKTDIHRCWSESCVHPIRNPTPIMEDKQAAISQVVKDQLSPNMKHLNILP